MLERLPHAILMDSEEGGGELEFAQTVAQSLLCEDRKGEIGRASCRERVCNDV